MEFSRSAVWEHRIIRIALVMIPVSHVIALQMIEKTKFAFLESWKEVERKGDCSPFPINRMCREEKQGKE